MPSVEGIIPRKVLPIFVVVQEIGDNRDFIYRSIIDGLIGKYRWINEKNADVEACVHLLKFNSEGIFTTDSLLSIDAPIDFDASLKATNIGGTFGNVLDFLSGALSVKGCLSAEIGYYEPIIFFFIDELEIDEDSVKKINVENKWFQRSTKLAISFSDYSEKFKSLLGTREAVFTVSKDMDENKIEELVDVIYDIRINSITHSIQTNFSQTGDICAAMFRGAIDEPNEYSESLYNFSGKQQQFKTLVAVDPIEETEDAVGEPIVLAGALATPEELAIDEVPIEPVDSEKNADTNVDDDWASGTWDD